MIDLKKFKHVSSDDKCTVLEHKDGHRVTIMHKKLSKDFNTQLDALKAASPKTDEQPKEAGKQHAKVEKTKDDKPKAAEQKAPAMEAPIKEAEGGMIDKAGQALDNLADKISGQKYPASRAPASEPVKPENVRKYGFDKAFAEGGAVDDSLKFDPFKETHGSTADERYGAIKQDSQFLSDFPEMQQAFTNDTMKLENVQREQNAMSQQKDAAQQAATKQELGLTPDAPQTLAAPIYNKDEQGNPIAPASPMADVTPSATPAGGVPQDQGLAAAAPATPNPMDMQGMYQGALQNQMAGINQASQAQQQLANQQQEVYKQQQAHQQEALDVYNKEKSVIDTERKALTQDIQNNHISMDKYWTGDKDGNGSHSKIMTGIGMILAGFDPAGRGNSAVDMLKHQMEMNLKAQGMEMDKKNNLLKMNIQEMGNLRDGMNMTRLMQADMVGNMLNQAAAKAANPMAKAAALQATGKLQQEFAPVAMQLEMRRAMMNLANNPGGPKDGAIQQMISYKRAMGDHAGAKELEEHYVPGIGYSPTQAIPQEIRGQLVMRNNFDKMARQYYDFAKQHSGSVDPKTIAQGKTLAAELQGAYRNATNGGVFKAGEQDFIEKLVPDNPTQFLADMRTLPKIKTLIETNHSQLNNTKQTYGLPAQSQAPIAGGGGYTPQQMMQWAQANPTDPRAAKILQHLKGK